MQKVGTAFVLEKDKRRPEDKTMLSIMKGSRILYPRGTWLTMVLIIAVFGAFGLWVGASADISHAVEITNAPSPFDPLLQIFLPGK
jgi:hypothetical protein